MIVTGSPRWETLVFTLLSFLASSSAQSILPSNESSTIIPQPNALVLTILNGMRSIWTSDLSPLTIPAQNATPSGTTFVATATNQLNITNSVIAFISCDPSSYPGILGAKDIYAYAKAQNAAAIVFYSNTSNYCTVSMNSDNAYSFMYTTMNRGYTNMLITTLQDGPQPGLYDAMIGPRQVNNGTTNGTTGGSDQSGTQNNPWAPTSSTAVAMIILYTITGLITSLFLVIIITGAVRAHRHPERYGPRRFNGGSRQTRARGLARAMLDTIPIVKVRGRSNSKPDDLEMISASGEGNADAGNQTNPQMRESVTANKSVGQSTDGTSRSLSQDGEGGIAVASPAQPHGVTEEPIEGCSICTEDFEIGQDQRVLPCDHRFHPACIDPWLLNVSGTCPLCRIDLRPQNADDSSEADAAGEVGEGEAAALPLNARTGRRSVRRSVLYAIAGPRRPDGMSREERVQALRRYRMAQSTRRGQSQTSMPPLGEVSASNLEEARTAGDTIAEVEDADGGPANVEAGSQHAPPSSSEVVLPAAPDSEEESRLRRNLRRLLNVRTRRTGNETDARADGTHE